MKKIILLILPYLVLVSAPTAAQDIKQTPENAHRFLKMLSDGNRIKYIPFGNVIDIKSYACFNSFNDRLHPTTCIKYFQNGMKVKPVTSRRSLESYNLAISISDSCRTSVVRNNASDKQEYWTEFGDIQPNELTNLSLAHIRYLNDNGIQWSRVSSATAKGSGVILTGPAISGNYLELVFESADMATRAAYAIEVIRQSCDSTAVTGF